MSLSTKWILWFAAIGLYVMFMSGMFYYHSSRFDYDEQLKQESIDLVRNDARVLIDGLSRKKEAITIDELGIITRISKDPRVAALTYFNRYGDVRWFKDPAKIGLSFDEFSKQWPPPTNAIDEAYRSKIPKIRPVPDQPLYEIAIPLAVVGNIVGIVNMQISRTGVDTIIGQKMFRFSIGAAVVLAILGCALYFFMHHFVINPLLDLRDAIETISFKNLELKSQPRQDEIGEVSHVLQLFLQKVKGELSSAQLREKQRGVSEQRWWQSILQAIVSKQHFAIVVDEDNTVLYTNFQIKEAAGGGRPHLLDVLDSQQQEVLRLVGVALDRPNQVIEADAVFRREPCHVRAIHLEEEGELRRTLVLFEPKRFSAATRPA